MKYILYCRKSTDTEDKQVLSLESQEKELTDLAKDRNLEIVQILTEKKSAKAPGRPIFNEMMASISVGKADAILCWKIDRLTRNPVDGGQIQWLLQNGNIKCIQTSEKTYLPSDNVLLMSIEQAMANQYIRDLSTNVKRGNRAKLEHGGWPNHAPFGYLNDKATNSIILDKKHAKYVPRMFELYITGAHSLQQIADILHSEGLRTCSGDKVRKGKIHKVLSNKFYIGLMERDGKIYQGNHETLISKVVFDKAQDILNGRIHSRKRNHFYSARGFLQCASCGCNLTCDTKKGFKYYYCTNGKGNCEQHKKYMRSEFIDELLSKMFLNLKFDEQLIQLSADAYKEANQDKINYVQSNVDTITNELESLTKKESVLTDGYASEVIKPDLYKQKMLEIENKKTELQAQLREIQSKGPVTEVTFEQIKNIFMDGNRASEKYIASGDEVKRNMLSKLLSNATIKNQEVAQYQFKSPYQVLANTPKNINFEKMCRGEDSNLHELLRVVLSHVRLPISPPRH